MRVLGIDPGLRLTGFACIDAAGVSPRDCRVVEAGVFRLSAGLPVPDRLMELERDLGELLERTRPDGVFVERLYSSYKNPGTAILMGHARGVILLAVRRAGVQPRELPPASVKKALTGNGQAKKAQVRSAVCALLGLQDAGGPADVFDAVAIAVSGAWRSHDVAK